jgi:hypothetical protein
VPRRFSENMLVGLVHLQDGEDWEDKLEFTFTREEANTILVLCAMNFNEFLDALDGARNAASEGDLLAMMAKPSLLEQARGMQKIIRAIARVVSPDIDKVLQEKEAEGDLTRD